MFIKSFKKISYTLLLSTVVIAATPLKAMDPNSEDLNPKTLPTLKFDPNNNNENNIENTENKIPILSIGVSINPSKEPFYLQFLVRKMIIQNMIGGSPDWVNNARCVLSFLEKHNLNKRSLMVDETFYAILGRLMPIGPQPSSFSGDDFFKENFSSDVDNLFAPRKNDNSFTEAMNSAILEWVNESDKKQLGSVCKNLGTLKSNFKDALSVALGEKRGCYHMFPRDDVNNYKDFFNMFCQLKLTPHGFLDTEILEAMAKLKTLKELDLRQSHMASLYPLSESSIEMVDLSFSIIGDLTPLAKMPKLQVLNIVGSNLRNLNVLIQSKSLKEIIVSSNLDVSSLEEAFDIEKDDCLLKILKKKT